MTDYSQDTSRYDSPILQALGWGFSPYADNEIPPLVDVPSADIPSWISPDYPFVEPSEDIQGLVVDAFLSFNGTVYDGIVLRRITKHSAGQYSVRFEDTDGRLIFETENFKGTYRHTVWGGYYELLYWETPTTTLKMIVRSQTEDSYLIYPKNGLMDARALSPYPATTSTITVINDEGSVNVGKHINFVEGTNVQLEERSFTDGVRNVTEITISAIAGAGTGKEESICKQRCDKNEDSEDVEEDAGPVYTINGIKPDSNGNFYIQTDGCHTVRGTNHVSLGNDCSPCCECEDMSEFARLLNDIEDLYYKLGGKSDALVENYTKEVKKLEEKLEEQLSTDDTPMCLATFDVSFQNRIWCGFRFTLKNLQETCYKKIIVRLHGSNLGDYNSSNPGIYNLHVKGPVPKNYSDCYVIDEMPEAVPLKTTYGGSSAGHSRTVEFRFDNPLATAQQLSISGLWKLDTRQRDYSIRAEWFYLDEEGNEIPGKCNDEQWRETKTMHYDADAPINVSDDTGLLGDDEINKIIEDMKESYYRRLKAE